MMAVLQINVNHSPQVQDLAVETALRVNAQVIILSEPYLFNGRLPSTPGWSRVTARRAAILIKDGLKHFVISGGNDSVVAVEIQRTMVISAYLSPNEDPSVGLDVIQSLLNRGRRVILAGDFNCRTPRTSHQTLRPRDHAFIHLIEANGLLVANNLTPTLERPGYLGISDFTLSKGTEVNDWHVLEDLDSLSDHRYIVFSIDIQLPPTRTIKKTDPTIVEELLDHFSPPLIVPRNPESCNHYAAEITRFLGEVVLKATTERTIKSRSTWWSEELETVYQRLKGLRRRSRRNKSEYYGRLARALRKDFRWMIRDAKKQAWRKFVSINTPWGKPYKAVVKASQRIPQQIPNEELLRVKIGGNPPVQQTDEGVSTSSGIDPELADPSTVVSGAEVARILKASRNRSAPGPDNITYKVLKKFYLRFPLVLSRLFTACLQQGVFPDIWKNGEVIWLPKAGKDPNAPDGYRPITLLSTLGKTFEKCIATRLWAHIDENAILSSRQYGFISKKGTEDSIHGLLTDLEATRNTYNLVAVVTLDIRAAFDTVSWDHLKDELRRYRFPDYLFAVICSYLNTRVVKSGNAAVVLERGCPQGSVLGPVMWNIAYNFVLEEFAKAGVLVTCYADDTAMVIGACTESQLIRRVEKRIEQASELVKRAGLQINAAKTEVMVVNGFSMGKLAPEPIAIKTEEHTTTSRRIIKYLGITLDDQLLWSPHITGICEKSEKILPKVTAICANTYGYSNEARRVMLDGTIGAYFRYGAFAFAHRLEANRSRVSALHRRMAIACGRMYRTVSYYPASVIANYPPLDLSITQHALLRCWWQGWSPPGSLPLRLPDDEALSLLEVRENLELQLSERWQQRYEDCNHGAWTRYLLPNVGQDICGLDFYLAQAISGHGCFREYLFRFKRATSPTCECGQDETPEHVFLHCPLHANERPTGRLNLDEEARSYLRKIILKLWKQESERERQRRMAS